MGASPEAWGGITTKWQLVGIQSICLSWSQIRGLGEKGIVQNHSIEPVKKINARESVKENKKENLAKRTGNFGSQIPWW